MIASFILSCGAIWYLLFGCSSEEHVPVTNTIIETNRQEEETEQKKIEAQTEQAEIRATAEAHNMKVHESINKYYQDSLAERNLQMQVHASERLHAEQRARTERQQNLIILFTSIVLTAGAVSIVYILKSETNSSQQAMLPSMTTYQFRANAELDEWSGWEVLKQGRTFIGVTPNKKQYRLTG